MAFHPIDRDTDYLLPPSVQEWLPESHLARYVVDVVEGLELTELERAYAGRGSDAYHPATLLGLSFANGRPLRHAGAGQPRTPPRQRRVFTFLPS